MNRKLLHVGKERFSYVSYYDVTYVDSFEEAKRIIAAAEKEGVPFNDMSIPKKPLNGGLFASARRDLESGEDPQFWDFIAWIENRPKKYGIAVYGLPNTNQFVAIRDYISSRGISFLD